MKRSATWRVGWGLAALMVAGCGGGSAPEPYTATESNFRALFPGRPRVSEQSQPSPAGPLKMKLYQLEGRDKVIYTVVVSELPAALVQGKSPDPLLDNGVRGGLAASGWIEQGRETVDLSGHPGRDVRFEARAEGSGERGLGRMRIYLVGDRLYQLITVGPGSKVTPEGMAHFLDSFALLRDVPALASSPSSALSDVAAGASAVVSLVERSPAPSAPSPPPTSAPNTPPTTASSSSVAPPAPAGRVGLPPGVGDDPRWVVLLFGDDPRAWNSSGAGGTYAVPLDRAPAGLKFLRLRRMDTGEALIVPLARDRLVSAVSARDEPDAPFRWCGANRDEFGGRHLGIAEGPLLRGDASRGKVAVQMEGTDAFVGSGFGHEAYGDGRTQHFGWRGEKIAPTAFEIAVTAGALTDSERPLLLSERLQAELTAGLPPPPADADPGWTVLLRGRDPSAWNTKGKGDTYALPLALAPGDVKYLRLKRLDNGEAVIIPLTRKDLSKEFPEGERPYRWCGTNTDQWGARHLGIGEGPLLRGGELQGKGIVVVAMAGFDGFTGSGFGHEAHGDSRTQHFAWRGKKIEPTDFEIAVSSGELSANERKALLGP